MKTEAVSANGISLKRQLLLILFSILIPTLVFQIMLSWSWVQSRYNLQLEKNQGVANAIRSSFQRYVGDIVRGEKVVGRSVLSLSQFDKRNAEQLLETAAQNYPSVVNFIVLDSTGSVIAGNPRYIGMDLARADYVKPVLQGEDVYLSNLRLDLLNGRPGFAISTAIKSADEKLSGLVVGLIRPELLSEIIFHPDRPTQDNFTIFDRNGALVYSAMHTTLTDSFRTEFGRNDPLLKEALKGEIAVGQLQHLDESFQRIAVRVPVPPYGWVVGTSEPSWVVYRPVVSDVALSILGIVAIVVFAIWFGNRTISKVIKSVSALQSHARQVGQGDYTHKTYPSGINEFDSLVFEFNNMGNQLQERNEAIKQRTEELERSNQELEQFAYVASHDLQEPLRTIAGYLQLIERRYKGKLDKDADEFIAYAVNGAHRLGVIINDLLAFSRVGTRGKPFVQVNAVEVVDEVLQGMKASIDNAEARIEIGKLPEISADPNQFRQLMQNLISNGLKFRHPDRTPVIRVEATKTDGSWTFSVQDNGIGFEPQYEEKIFMAFKRLHTQDKYPGSGIGLAICRKIVQRHGGRIWAESVPGEGSTFKFTIPERKIS